jgi:hypothetical protein
MSPAPDLTDALIAAGLRRLDLPLLAAERWLQDHFRGGKDDTDLNQHTSNWGARRLDDKWLPDLSFNSFGPLTSKGAAAIRAKVYYELGPLKGRVILFRGQKTMTPNLCCVPSDPAQRRALIWKELKAAACDLYQMLKECENSYCFLSPPEVFEKLKSRKLKTLREATPLDALSLYHGKTYGSPLLVAASRSLSVAAGDYNMITSYNNNRYLYVLAVPEDQVVNIFGTEKYFAERSTLGVKRNSYDNGKSEYELCVWLDATPYVVGVYDTAKERWVEEKDWWKGDWWSGLRELEPSFKIIERTGAGSPERLALALVDDDAADKITFHLLKHMEVDVAELRGRLEDLCRKPVDCLSGKLELHKLLEQSSAEAVHLCDPCVTTEHLLLAMTTADSELGNTLRTTGINRDRLLEALKQVRGICANADLSPVKRFGSWYKDNTARRGNTARKSGPWQGI